MKTFKAPETLPLTRPMRERSSRRVASGFTLLELLVAMVVLVGLSTILLSVTGYVANTWEKAENQNQLRQNARVVMEFLRRDLQQIIFPLESNDKLVYLVQNPATLLPEYRHRDALFWRAAVAAPSHAGDLAGIAYFLRKDGPTYTLCRALINPEEWAEATDEQGFFQDQPETWVQAAPASKESHYRGLFLKDVLGFWVTAYRENGTTVYQPDTRSDGMMPSRFDISLVFLDKTGATRLRAASASAPDAAGYADAEAYVAGIDEALKAHVGIVKISVPLEKR